MNTPDAAVLTQQQQQQHGGHGLLEHQFTNMEQQREAKALCMWLFLCSEVLFFGGLFMAYAVMRYRAPEGFALGSQQLSATLGGFNTAVLLTSSLSVALAVYAAQQGQRRFLQVSLIATLVLGLAFLGIKGWEWHHEYEEKLVPGPTFLIEDDGHPKPVPGLDSDPRMRSVPVRGMQMFYVFYFIITGLHALHMIAGLATLGIMIVLTFRGSFGVEDYSPIEVFGLYWHFVDVVWIFVFPLLYLLRT